tara:strand:- start:1416 stop:2099 length:684 start_codon:yes stop_codon:yes gene_type:complete
MFSTKTLLITMATLTYDPTPADQPEFTPDEQDSIAVGEALEQQQEQLLAGKYANAQELEKAYVELQRKLGGESEDEESDVPEEAESEEEEEQEEVESDEESEEPDVLISQEDIDSLHEMVGGQEMYQEMVSWAADNMSEQEIQMYDYVMDLNNPWAAFFAVKALQNTYENANGRDGQLLTGRGATEVADVFRSQAEVVAAMGDPRYESDPAYRNDVFQKLDRSNLNF